MSARHDSRISMFVRAERTVADFGEGLQCTVQKTLGRQLAVLDIANKRTSHMIGQRCGERGIPAGWG